MPIPLKSFYYGICHIYKRDTPYYDNSMYLLPCLNNNSVIIILPFLFHVSSTPFFLQHLAEDGIDPEYLPSAIVYIFKIFQRIKKPYGKFKMLLSHVVDL